MHQTRRHGFTLIELLFAVALIGILSGFIVLALGSARGKGRDARRKHDLTQIKDALELYSQDQKPQRYYAASSVVAINGTTDELSVALLGTYTKKMPVDPRNSGVYIYHYASFGNGANYEISATLEDKNDPAGNNGAVDGYIVSSD